MKYEQLEELRAARKAKGLPEDLTMEEIKEVIGDSSFREASTMGTDYAKAQGYASTEDAPFCIETVNASRSEVVVAKSLKPLIDKMKTLAVEQSDKDGKKNDNYEAIFMLVGERGADGKIVLTEGSWDERGYEPNRFKYSDPDAYDYGWGFYSSKSNVAEISDHYLKVLNGVVGSSQGDKKVIVYGHTHPMRAAYGKINNYPSRSDITAAVAEALNYYQAENGTCTFLNAIINADGDLNIFGYDVKGEKFEIMKKIRYSNGEKIPAYTDGLYPIEKATGCPGNE